MSKKRAIIEDSDEEDYAPPPPGQSNKGAQSKPTTTPVALPFGDDDEEPVATTTSSPPAQEEPPTSSSPSSPPAQEEPPTSSSPSSPPVQEDNPTSPPLPPAQEPEPEENPASPSHPAIQESGQEDAPPSSSGGGDDVQPMDEGEQGSDPPPPPTTSSPATVSKGGAHGGEEGGDCDEKLRKQKEELERECEKKLREQKEKHDKEVEKMKQNYTETLREQREKHAKELERLNQKLKEREGEKEQSQKEIKKLVADIEIVGADNRKLKGELDQLKAVADLPEKKILVSNIKHLQQALADSRNANKKLLSQRLATIKDIGTQLEANVNLPIVDNSALDGVKNTTVAGLHDELVKRGLLAFLDKIFNLIVTAAGEVEKNMGTAQQKPSQETLTETTKRVRSVIAMIRRNYINLLIDNVPAKEYEGTTTLSIEIANILGKVEGDSPGLIRNNEIQFQTFIRGKYDLNKDYHMNELALFMVRLKYGINVCPIDSPGDPIDSGILELRGKPMNDLSEQLWWLGMICLLFFDPQSRKQTDVLLDKFDKYKALTTKTDKIMSINDLASDKNKIRKELIEGARFFCQAKKITEYASVAGPAFKWSLDRDRWEKKGKLSVNDMSATYKANAGIMDTMGNVFRATFKALLREHRNNNDIDLAYVHPLAADGMFACSTLFIALALGLKVVNSNQINDANMFLVDTDNAYKRAKDKMTAVTKQKIEKIQILWSEQLMKGDKVEKYSNGKVLSIINTSTTLYLWTQLFLAIGLFYHRRDGADSASLTGVMNDIYSSEIRKGGDYNVAYQCLIHSDLKHVDYYSKVSEISTPELTDEELVRRGLGNTPPLFPSSMMAKAFMVADGKQIRGYAIDSLGLSGNAKYTRTREF